LLMDADPKVEVAVVEDAEEQSVNVLRVTE
jgi:hypothetical protein